MCRSQTRENHASQLEPCNTAVHFHLFDPDKCRFVEPILPSLMQELSWGYLDITEMAHQSRMSKPRLLQYCVHITIDPGQKYPRYIRKRVEMMRGR